MPIRWTDTEEIAIQLFEKFPDVDPINLRFTDLYQWVTELEEFDDDVGGSKEKILEAIQSAWIEEREDADD